MIKELTEHIYGWDEQGNPAIAGPPTQEEIVDKINEIIRYINEHQNSQESNQGVLD